MELTFFAAGQKGIFRLYSRFCLLCVWALCCLQLFFGMCVVTFAKINNNHREWNKWMKRTNHFTFHWQPFGFQQLHPHTHTHKISLTLETWVLSFFAHFKAICNYIQPQSIIWHSTNWHIFQIYFHRKGEAYTRLRFFPSVSAIDKWVKWTLGIVQYDMVWHGLAWYVTCYVPSQKEAHGTEFHMHTYAFK